MTTKAKGNGKDEVDGKAAKSKGKKEVFGLRVTAAKISEEAEGGARTTVTIAGIAHGMSALVGHTVSVETIGGERRLSAHVRSVKLSEPKGGGMRSVQIEASGDRHFSDLVGRGVKVSLTKSQKGLFGAAAERDEIEAEEGPVPFSPAADPGAAEGSIRKGGRRRGSRAPEARA